MNEGVLAPAQNWTQLTLFDILEKNTTKEETPWELV